MAQIEIKTVEPMNVLSLPFTGSYQETGQHLDELLARVLRAGHPWSTPPVGVFYDDPSKVEEDKLRGEIAVCVEEEFNGDEAGHTTYSSCEQKGRAVWWMLAEISGW